MSEAKQAALAAKAAAPAMAQASTELKDKALLAMAAALRAQTSAICEANATDCAVAKEKGISPSMLDRLSLNEARIESMASALEQLANLADPVGKVVEEHTLYNGLQMRRVTVPLGVVAMVYEARPNVTADAAGICVKSGNACVLRGGSSAINSNMAIAKALREAVASVGLPADAVVAISSTSRTETDNLLRLRGLVDVLIPRGGAGLIQHCVECATVPVIETGVGNCHVYVHETANFEMARAIIMNAKTQRPSVCNACESVLVDYSAAKEFLPQMLTQLTQAGVTVHGDELVRSCAALASEGVSGEPTPLGMFVDATVEDWGREYLGLEISIKCISGGVEEAIAHINQYGTGHSECIVAADNAAITRFQQGVDAAAVYANASTRFTDGGEFGLGAEIGISTQKLHVRGPFALEALTSTKYLINGEGQVRG
jgi:glutamate-5-semialdehyde dehydrogenase